jgi:ribosomal protein S18 acetylase RimI-like enzyme
VEEGKPIVDVAAEEELGAVLSLQKLAFQTSAELCGDYSIPPLRQTLDQLIEESRSSRVLVARVDGELVGTVRSHREGSTCHVARLAVHPEFRRRGIARKLLEELERRASENEGGPGRYELFTAEADCGAIALYQGNGYRIFRTERPAVGPPLVFMEKTTSRNS